MSKCVMDMTPPEILSANVADNGCDRSLLIEDLGGRWCVTEYSPDAAGLGSEHITIHSAMDEIEKILVKMRRSESPVDLRGETITDPEQVAKELTGR